LEKTTIALTSFEDPSEALGVIDEASQIGHDDKDGSNEIRPDVEL